LQGGTSHHKNVILIFLKALAQQCSNVGTSTGLWFIS